MSTATKSHEYVVRQRESSTERARLARRSGQVQVEDRVHALRRQPVRVGVLVEDDRDPDRVGEQTDAEDPRAEERQDPQARHGLVLRVRVGTELERQDEQQVREPVPGVAEQSWMRRSALQLPSIATSIRRTRQPAAEGEGDQAPETPLDRRSLHSCHRHTPIAPASATAWIHAPGSTRAGSAAAGAEKSGIHRRSTPRRPRARPSPSTTSSTWETWIMPGFAPGSAAASRGSRRRARGEGAARAWGAKKRHEPVPFPASVLTLKPRQEIDEGTPLAMWRSLSANQYRT